MLHKSAFRFTDIYIQGMGKYSPLILRLSNGRKEVETSIGGQHLEMNSEP